MILKTLFKGLTPFILSILVVGISSSVYASSGLDRRDVGTRSSATGSEKRFSLLAGDSPEKIAAREKAAAALATQQAEAIRRQQEQQRTQARQQAEAARRAQSLAAAPVTKPIPPKAVVAASSTATSSSSSSSSSSSWFSSKKSPPPPAPKQAALGTAASAVGSAAGSLLAAYNSPEAVEARRRQALYDEETRKNAVKFLYRLDYLSLVPTPAISELSSSPEKGRISCKLNKAIVPEILGDIQNIVFNFYPGSSKPAQYKVEGSITLFEQCFTDGTFGSPVATINVGFETQLWDPNSGSKPVITNATQLSLDYSQDTSSKNFSFKNSLSPRLPQKPYYFDRKIVVTDLVAGVRHSFNPASLTVSPNGTIQEAQDDSMLLPYEWGGYASTYTNYPLFLQFDLRRSSKNNFQFSGKINAESDVLASAWTNLKWAAGGVGAVGTAVLYTAPCAVASGVGTAVTAPFKAVSWLFKGKEPKPTDKPEEGKEPVGSPHHSEDKGDDQEALPENPVGDPLIKRRYEIILDVFRLNVKDRLIQHFTHTHPDFTETRNLWTVTFTQMDALNTPQKVSANPALRNLQELETLEMFVPDQARKEINASRSSILSTGGAWGIDFNRMANREELSIILGSLKSVAGDVKSSSDAMLQELANRLIRPSSSVDVQDICRLIEHQTLAFIMASHYAGALETDIVSCVNTQRKAKYIILIRKLMLTTLQAVLQI